jgi:hypothetical protein
MSVVDLTADHIERACKNHVPLLYFAHSILQALLPADQMVQSLSSRSLQYAQ